MQRCVINRLASGLRRESVRCGACPDATAMHAPSTTRIRGATLEDAETLHRIIHSSYRTTKSWTTEHELVAGERISQDGIAQLIEDGVDRIFVAEIEMDNGRVPAGCICVELACRHEDMALPDDHAMLGLFAVDPEHQSRGIGNKLLSHALDFVKEENCKFVTIWVIEQREDIMAWYARKGFVHTDKRVPFVFPDLALVEDMHFKVMQKSLQ